MILNDCYISINGTDLSDLVKQVKLDLGVEEKDDATMGDLAKSSTPGLLVYGLSITAIQSFAAGKIDATLFPLLGNTGFTIIIRPVKTGGVGATNPNYSGTFILSSYSPLDGSHGDLLMAPIRFSPAGGAMMTRAVI